ncbi:MAG: amino acid--tRNA ligase-related protein, partial [Pseudomonadota bacterium]
MPEPTNPPINPPTKPPVEPPVEPANKTTSYVAIKSLLQHDVALGTFVEVRGWVRSRRTSKGGFSFVHVHDGSCFATIQAVADGNLDNYSSEVVELVTGCSVVIQGTLVESQGKGQDREIQAHAIQVLGWVEDPESYPISKKQHSFEYLRSVAHLRPRTNTFGAIARVRHRIAQAVHQYFSDAGFFWVNTPIITASDCEGAGELFRVSTLDQVNRSEPPDYSQDFFGTETYLTVSGQLNVESFCCALSKVYTFGPTFRAENSNTSRHLAEFWMIEPEVAFADLRDNAKLAEQFLQHVI